jgi:hypothetical protein
VLLSLNVAVATTGIAFAAKGNAQSTPAMLSVRVTVCFVVRFVAVRMGSQEIAKPLTSQQVF